MGASAKADAPIGFKPPLAAAAAGKDKDSNNDYPDAVVVEKIAQAVVHIISIPPPKAAFKILIAPTERATSVCVGKRQRIRICFRFTIIL